VRSRGAHPQKASFKGIQKGEGLHRRLMRVAKKERTWGEIPGCGGVGPVKKETRSRAKSGKTTEHFTAERVAVESGKKGRLAHLGREKL